MKVEGIEVARGMDLYCPHATPTGNTLWRAGQVVDTNEHVKAVKLRCVINIKQNKQKSEWFPVQQLRLSPPP